MFGFRRKVADRTDEIMRKYLDGHFQCYAAHDDAPAARQLEAVARKYGCRLPDDFVAHSTGRMGGVYIEVKEEVWPRAKAYDVGQFWSFLYGVYVYGLSPKIPDWMNLDLAAAEFKESTGHSLVPCLKLMGDSDLYLFNDSAQLVQWHHETGELVPVGLSFFDLFEREVRELRERKERKIAEA